MEKLIKYSLVLTGLYMAVRITVNIFFSFTNLSIKGGFYSKRIVFIGLILAYSL